VDPNTTTFREFPKWVAENKDTLKKTRRRDAATTRKEIFNSAMHLFSEKSYEAVGLREIVSGVGVDVSLIKRYFGSKEKLFAEVVDYANSTHITRGLLTGDGKEVANKLARFITDIDSDDEHRAFNLMSLMVTLRAVHSERGRSILRANMEKSVLDPLAEWLNGPYSSERAALLTAYLMGVATMQRLIKVDALVDKDLDIVVSFVAAALETCINGQPSVLTGKQ